MSESNGKNIEGPQMGRPCLPEHSARSERVVTLLTKPQRAELVLQAKRHSLSVSGYCHQLITEGLAKNKGK